MDKCMQNNNINGERNELTFEGEVVKTADTKELDNLPCISNAWIINKIIKVILLLLDPTLFGVSILAYQIINDFRHGKHKGEHDKKINIINIIRLYCDLS